MMKRSVAERQIASKMNDSVQHLGIKDVVFTAPSVHSKVDNLKTKARDHYKRYRKKRKPILLWATLAKILPTTCRLLSPHGQISSRGTVRSSVFLATGLCLVDSTTVVVSSGDIASLTVSTPSLRQRSPRQTQTLHQRRVPAAADHHRVAVYNAGSAETPHRYTAQVGCQFSI
eukprot:scpid66484/ scgid29491/ 